MSNWAEKAALLVRSRQTISLMREYATSDDLLVPALKVERIRAFYVHRANELLIDIFKTSGWLDDEREAEQRRRLIETALWKMESRRVAELDEQAPPA